jgi:hypothetical protein
VIVFIPLNERKSRARVPQKKMFAYEWSVTRHSGVPDGFLQPPLEHFRNQQEGIIKDRWGRRYARLLNGLGREQGELT